MLLHKHPLWRPLCPCCNRPGPSPGQFDKARFFFVVAGLSGSRKTNFQKIFLVSERPAKNKKKVLDDILAPNNSAALMRHLRDSLTKHECDHRKLLRNGT
eukprot:gnl/TRDRNA2_/TRDRNA2_171693_c3_seq3.p2 gnl/TRDRNA2_/TRDRNA2_171693_c3~~gnl/TRDRNA2_/TRDRNA2_171693_c3_seq3.p2  ORF type:complete len:100 (+),score=11.20 gnl/TRDRNA2_/TRDRNA2_171693_c3_seq3:53-352(+)